MASTSYCLSIKSAEGISWRSKPFNQQLNLYVEVFVDKQQAGQTRVIKRGLPATWDENLLLPSTTQASMVTIRVNHRTSLPVADPCIATVNKSVGALLHLCEAKTDAKLELESNGRKSSGGPNGVIFVSIEAVTREQVRQMATRNVREDIERGQVNHGPGHSRVDGMLGIVGSAVAVEQSDLVQSLGIVLWKVKLIADATVDVMDEISKVHPYANAAWQILNSLHKAYKTQCETEAKVVALVAQMAELYSFVDDVEPLWNKIKLLELESTIIDILEQTTECAIFVREYTNHGSGRRLAAQALSNAVEKIQNLSQGLTAKSDILKIRADIHKKQTDILKILNPVVMDASCRPECLLGTRQEILKTIIDWLTAPCAEPSVIWVHGVAGSGKSTIATTIAEYFRRLHRRGAFLFFDRNSPARSGPAGFIRTLVHQLAGFNATLRATICAAIENNPQIATASLSAQFTTLVLEPLRSCSSGMPEPIVVILDAFDECGDAESRRTLLTVLSTRLAEVPHQFRFLFTSRSELDIRSAFEHQTYIKSIALDASESSGAADVLLYIKHETKVLYGDRRHSDELPLDWPGETAINQLATHAAGLFIWASTAMKFLRTADDPVERLDYLLDRDTPGAFTLDDLYATALRSAISWGQNTSFAANCRRVLGAIVVGRVPLTDMVIDQLVGLERSKSCRIVLRRLGCLLQWAEGSPIRTLHASFADYLTDSNACGSEPWFVDETENHSMLTAGCLKIMKNFLRFNICGLETSHVLNDDVPNIIQRVAGAIPAHLVYSCCYWADHLERTPYSLRTLDLVTEFMHIRLLFWLETLSLMKKVHVASHMLLIVVQWCENGDSAQDFAADSIKFIATFAGVISYSAPHIYLSAVPFAPQTSKLRKKYLPTLPGTLFVQSGLDEIWPPCQQIIQGHTDWVYSVAFSPNGEHLASGSRDHTIRIWDVMTGILVSGPFEGHNDSVRTVAFSPDSKHVASGSSDNTIRVWDAQTGVCVSGPFEGHTKGVLSVAFSLDGKHVASGSADHTVRIWDVEKGVLVSGPFNGPTDSVWSVAFSPDGEHIASGSQDETIWIWGAKTGVLVSGPFEGHTDPVLSVAFSPDGKRIASGSNDRTIRIWNVQTGTLVSGPLHAHTDYVNSVAFSPDGTHVASGSSDKTIRIWDTKKGILVSGPFEGSTESVRSVAFSPDGKPVASGSYDNTIQIWDAEACVLASGSFEGHTNAVTSVAFSPDGKVVASGSDDKTVRVWDAETGVPVCGPFKGHTKVVCSAVFSPNGTHIASGSYDNTIRTWDAQTGTLVSGPFKGHTDWVRSVAFSPDGKHIASGSDDNTIRLWDAGTGAFVSGSFEGHTNGGTSVAFSPDGKVVASGSYDKTIRVWDAETGVLTSGPFKGHTGYIHSVAFSPDGRHIASSSNDSTIRLWDVATGILVCGPFKGHTGPVNSVAFSPNGKHIASGSKDQTIRIWDAQTGIFVSGPFDGHTDSVTSVAFSPDGKRIVSGSGDKTIRIFATDMQIHSNPEISSSSNPSNLHALTPSTADANVHLHINSHLQSGWLMNSSTTLLFWLPPSYQDRPRLWQSNHKLVIGGQSLRLDLSRFVHGSDWHQCHIAGAST